MGKNDKLFIAVSGMIAAGKTTLTVALGKEMGLPVYLEDVENNEYLKDFYKNPKKYAYPLQIYLLNKRLTQQQIIVWSGKGGIQDRSFYEDSIFCKMLTRSGHMDKRDYKTYLELFENISKTMKKPNLIVFLDVSPEESLERLKLRSRGIEVGVKLEYLKDLHVCYNEWINEISKFITVIKVNYSKFKTSEEMAKIIKREWKNTRNIIKIGY